MCAAFNLKFPYAASNARHRLRCTAWGFLDEPELTIATTATLSHRARNTNPFHSWPHVKAAMTMGTSSFTVMCTSLILLVQGNLNQCSPVYAPQPQVPDASDVKVIVGSPAWSVSIMAAPFHVDMKRYHHSMSALASLFSLMNWSRCLVDVERSIDLRR